MSPFCQKTIQVLYTTGSYLRRQNISASHGGTLDFLPAPRGLPKDWYQ